MPKVITRQEILDAVESWHKYDYKELVCDIISRLDNPAETTEENLWETAESTIIYNEDMWIILKEWCSPNEPDWDFSWQAFVMDCEDVLEALK